MEAVGGVLSAFGLAASAGLNAYVPLSLGASWEPLTSWWVIGALLVLGLIEFFADKIPAVNHANDLIQTFVRPAVAGGSSWTSSLSPVLGRILRSNSRRSAMANVLEPAAARLPNSSCISSSDFR